MAESGEREEAWIRVTLPSEYENDGWDMVIAAAEMLDTAARLLDHEAQAEHLNHHEAAVHFGSEGHD